MTQTGRPGAGGGPSHYRKGLANSRPDTAEPLLWREPLESSGEISAVITPDGHDASLIVPEGNWVLAAKRPCRQG
jgi:hypothetical protein